jgi:hypothetical protein
VKYLFEGKLDLGLGERERERLRVLLRLRERKRKREREGGERIMEESGIDSFDAIHEGRRSPLLAPDIEPDSGCEPSSWRINLQEFPSLPERGDGDHGSYNLRRLLHTTSKPSHFCDHVHKYFVLCSETNYVLQKSFAL